MQRATQLSATLTLATLTLTLSRRHKLALEEIQCQRVHKAAFEVEVVNPQGSDLLFQFVADDAADPDAAVFFFGSAAQWLHGCCGAAVA